MGCEDELKTAGADDARASLSSGTWEADSPEGSAPPPAAPQSFISANGGRKAGLPVGSPLEDQGAGTDAVTSMAVVAIHEIGNVIGWVDMALALVERETCDRNGAPAKAAIDIGATLRDARMGIRHITDILLSLQPLGQPRQGEPTPFDPVDALRAAIRFAELRIAGRAVLAQNLLPTPLVRGHKHELTCVFLNLLHNALDALPEGTPETDTITVIATATDGNACFEVHDTGVGIPAEVAERVFDPYFSGSPDSGGMGIGLHLCRRIVTEMGGTIAFESALGSGTRFRVTLPGCA